MSRINYSFFKAHFAELLERYSGKYVVIKDEAVIGAYESFDEAYLVTTKKEELGTFIIQQCVEISDDNTASFMSNNVMFAQV